MTVALCFVDGIWRKDCIMIVDEVSHGGSEWFLLGGTASYGYTMGMASVVLLHHMDPYGPLRNRDHCNA